MNILEELKAKGKLEAVTTQRLSIYYKDQISESICYDSNKNDELDPSNIDDSYGLEVEETDDTVEVFIPKNARVLLLNISANIDCAVRYKNIECDLIFEDDPIESYFEIVES